MLHYKRIFRWEFFPPAVIHCVLLLRVFQVGLLLRRIIRSLWPLVNTNEKTTGAARVARHCTTQIPEVGAVLVEELNMWRPLSFATSAAKSSSHAGYCRWDG